MARVEKTVFISYRRRDISWALAVYQYLTSQNYDVFFDYTSIPSGDFEQIIVSNIRARAHFILILTPTALDRCNEPGDWLRREVETAIDEKRNIVPLFFDGFNFGLPSLAEKLTGKLAAIKLYNGLDIPSGYFMEAMERLSSRYLNVPLNAVIHPVSTEVRKVVEEQHAAADKALVQKKDVIEEIVKPTAEKAQAFDWRNLPSKLTPRVVAGIATGVLLISLVFWGITNIGNNPPRSVAPEPTQTLSPTPFPTPTLTSRPEETKTPPPTSTITPPPPIPTLGIGSRLVSEKDGMTLLYVPAGEFTMGSEDGEDNEQPVHAVYLDAFWMDKTEVTNAMYARCIQAGDCQQPFDTTHYSGLSYTDHPVVSVSWTNAFIYCSWAERRLPTEAEWEKAARGDLDRKKYPWGDESPVCGKGAVNGAQFASCGSDTVPVGSFGENGYGLYDMAGNVWEWVSSLAQPYPYSVNDGRENLSPGDFDSLVLRGGSWNSGTINIRSATRNWTNPFSTYNYIGFRCAMDASE